MPGTHPEITAVFDQLKQQHGASCTPVFRAVPLRLQILTIHDLKAILDATGLKDKANVDLKRAQLLKDTTNDKRLECKILLEGGKKSVLVGTCDVHVTDGEEGVDVGLDFFRQHQSKGYGKAVMEKMLIPFVRDQLQATRIWGEVKEKNEGSLKFCTRLGYRELSMRPYKYTLANGNVIEGMAHYIEMRFDEPKPGDKKDGEEPK